MTVQASSFEISDLKAGMRVTLQMSAETDESLIVAITAGLMEAQLSNDPGGNRWTRHLNRLIDLLVDDVITRKGIPR